MLRLLLMQARRDRITLPIWIAGAALMAYASAAGAHVVFDTNAAREQFMRLSVAEPTLLALRGIPDGASTASYVNFQVFTYLAVLAGLMSTFLAVRHSRADEERGRSELALASPIRRTAPLAATVVLGLLANSALGAAVALSFIVGGLDARGSWLSGLAVAAVGVTFLGVGAVAAQAAATSRSANAIGASAVGLAFLLRAVGDAGGTPTASGLSISSAWPSWVSPIGWAQHVLGFTRQDLGPLALAGVAATLMIAIALIAQSRRDLGSSLLRERLGPAEGSLGSHIGLAWREQVPTLIGWAMGAVLMGALAGSLADRIANSNVAPDLEKIMRTYVPGGKGELIDVLIVAIVGIAGVLAAAAGTQSLIRARSEEGDGRTELVLAGPVGRVRWLVGYLIVALASAVLVCLSAGLAAGVVFLANGSAGSRFWSSLAAGASQLPAALVFIAITAAILVLVPRLTIPLGWLVLALGFTIGQFGGLLGLPDWVRDISPFAHTPGIPPLEGADWTGAWMLIAIAAAMFALAIAAASRRQLTS